jgi:hypothetical protein
LRILNTPVTSVGDEEKWKFVFDSIEEICFEHSDKLVEWWKFRAWCS